MIIYEENLFTNLNTTERISIICLCTEVRYHTVSYVFVYKQRDTESLFNISIRNFQLMLISGNQI